MEEYQKREAEFMARTDALCEHTPPTESLCSSCPCNGLCDWLLENYPYGRS